MKSHDERKIDNNQMWVFGYGSLIWKADFPFVERRTGYIKGWVRRFYQGSTDHRGTPAYPGRVVTLLPAEDEVTWGAAYRLPPNQVATILEGLDYREKNGYQRFEIDIYLHGTDNVPIIENALVYRATEDNEHYLGPAAPEEMAQQIATAVGPSGTNLEYFKNLSQAVCRSNRIDEHLNKIETAFA